MADFFHRRADDIGRDLLINTATKSVTEMMLYAAVFAGVKTQDSDAATRAKAGRNLPEERVERTEFIVHRNPDRLERPRDGGLARPVVNVYRQDRFYDAAQLHCRLDGL